MKNNLEQDVQQVAKKEAETGNLYQVLRKGPQNREVIEKAKALESKLEKLRQTRTALEKALKIEHLKEERANILAQINECEAKVGVNRQEVKAIAKGAEKNPHLHELLGKFGLRSLSKVQSLFNEIDNLTARVQHNWEEIRRLDAQIDRLSE